MDNGRISVRYAKAVYDFALEKKEESRLYEEMKILAGSFSSFRSLQQVMDDPTVLKEEKKKILKTAAGIEVSDTFNSLLNLVIANKRESYFHLIALMFQEYYRKRKGIVITQLTTTSPITPEMESRLKAVVSGKVHVEVDFNTIIDPSIIGGYILEVDDRRLDASVRTQLNQLKQELIRIK